MANSDGLFVTIEGIDNAGKSTLIEHLDKRRNDITFTAEPSDLWTGDIIHDMIESGEYDNRAEYFAFMLDRAVHVNEVIQPALERGEVVVADRYIHSTYAYQIPSAFTDQPTVFLEQTNNVFPKPDVVIYLDISVETALDREDDPDTYENRERLERAKPRYWQHLLRDERYDSYKLDGTKQVEDLTDRVEEIIIEKR